jgi:hypothetical protein
MQASAVLASITLDARAAENFMVERESAGAVYGEREI